jgi:hypothetical protein
MVPFRTIRWGAQSKLAQTKQTDQDDQRRLQIALSLANCFKVFWLLKRQAADFASAPIAKSG